MSIVRGSANGMLLALLLIRTDRRDELNFSFEYEAIWPDELRTDPAWTPISLASECLVFMSTGAGV
jgi:hypothetical protein